MKNYELRKLNDLWRRAGTPGVCELRGEYAVKMLTGPLLALNLLRDKKKFDGKGFGHNILEVGNKRWGYFKLEQDNEMVVINYDCENRFGNNIRDHIKRIGADQYIGRFNLLIRKKLRFLGYFKLTKIKKETNNEKI